MEPAWTKQASALRLETEYGEAKCGIERVICYQNQCRQMRYLASQSRQKAYDGSDSADGLGLMLKTLQFEHDLLLSLTAQVL